MNRLRSSVFILFFTLVFVFSATAAAFAVQSIEYTTNGAGQYYVEGSVLVLYGKVTDGGKAVPNTSVTVDIKDTDGKVIYYGLLKTNTAGYFKTNFTIPNGVADSMSILIKTASTALDPVEYSLTVQENFDLVGCIPQGYMTGDPILKIPVETERLGLVFSGNVNYFNNRNNNLDLDSLGVNERNRDCVDLYERDGSGNFIKVASSVDLVTSETDGGNVPVSGITFLQGFAEDDEFAPRGGYSRKNVLYLTPTNGLKADTTYKAVIDGDLSANSSATLGQDLTVFFRTQSSGSSGTIPGETTTGGAVVTPTAVNFEDISNHWAKSYIEAMANRGIVNGLTATTFAPDKSITRAEFAVLLSRVLNLKALPSGNGFSDVTEKAWYHDGVLQAVQAGIVLGDDGKFRPNDQIRRQEMALMLARAYDYAGGNAANGLQLSYSDKDKIASWAVEGVAQITSLQLMSGYPDGTFGPNRNSTRAEAVKTLKIFMDLMDY